MFNLVEKILSARSSVSCIFSWKEQSFTELLLAALKEVLDRCSTNVGVLQKAVLKCNSSALLIKSLKNNCEGVSLNHQKMISVTGIFPGLRQQVHFSDLVNVQMHKKANLFISIISKVFLDFFETSLVVKLYFYKRCTGGTIAFHESRLE